MPRLFVFGIGGTGSRVMKSLTMLLASGVKLGNFDTVVPLFIDPDGKNGDLTTTSNIIMHYQKIQNEIGVTDRNFFSTVIKPLPHLSVQNNPVIKNDLKFNFDGSGVKFKDFIGYQSLKNESSDLIDLLFSEKNLNSDITVGFKGNPNIGSIILNNFVGSKEYVLFKNSFKKEDSIFIVSSIFGGTGAAGFPLLLKNLRQNDATDDQVKLINESKIGALSILPYFKVETPEGGEVVSGTFLGKTKAALKYYKHAIIDRDLLDSFYSLGADTDFKVKYAEGKGEQENPAHLIELFGALCIKDFAEEVQDLEKNEMPKKAYGFKDGKDEPFDKQKIRLQNLPDKSRSYFMKELSKKFLFNSFIMNSRDVLLDSKGDFNTKELGIDPEEWGSKFADNSFNPFYKAFHAWINQLNDTPDWKFDVFYQHKDHKELLSFIKGKELKNSLFSKPANANNLIDELNKIAKSGKFRDDKSQWSRMYKIFNEALESQVSKLLK